MSQLKLSFSGLAVPRSVLMGRFSKAARIGVQRRKCFDLGCESALVRSFGCLTGILPSSLLEREANGAVQQIELLAQLGRELNPSGRGGYPCWSEPQLLEARHDLPRPLLTCTRKKTKTVGFFPFCS